MQVVDYSFSHPAPASIKSAGYVGVMRYLSPGPNSKNLTAGERDALLEAGLSIGVVWETVANRAAQGFDAGVQDAQLANGQADALGIPHDATIYFAVDFDADPNVVRAYFLGVNSVKRRPVGGYGGFAVVAALLDWGLVVMAWQTVAWSHGKVLDRAVLYQRADRAPISGTDVNDCRAPDWGQWPRPNTPAPIPPRRYKVNAVVSDPVSGETQIAELRDDGLVWLRNIKKDSPWYNAGGLPKDAGKALSLDAGYRRDGTLDVSVRTDKGVTWLNGAPQGHGFGGWYVP